MTRPTLQESGVFASDTWKEIDFMTLSALATKPGKQRKILLRVFSLRAEIGIGNIPNMDREIIYSALWSLLCDVNNILRMQ
jgi:hypothetical protein